MVTDELGRIESLHMQKKSAPKKKTKPPEPPQGERFKRFAEEHGATDDVLDRALREVGKAKPKRD